MATINQLRNMLEALVLDGKGHLEMRDVNDPDYTPSEIIVSKGFAFMDFKRVEPQGLRFAITDEGIGALEAYKLQRDYQEIDNR